MTAHFLYQTAIIGFLHIVATLVWVPPAKRLFKPESPALLLALSHVLALVVYILCCFLLGIAGLYTSPISQVVYVMVSGLGCLLGIRKSSWPDFGKTVLRIDWKVATWGLPILATALFVRLTDPALFVSYPSSDYTAFATNLRAHIQDHEVFTSYPSPLSLLFNGFQLGVDPWRRIPLGNQVLSLGALLSIYAWSRSFCTQKIAIVHTGIWAGAVFVLPILSMPFLFPQYTPVFTVFPLLLALEAGTRRDENVSGRQNAVAVLMLLLSMCATYFAILISAVFLLNKLLLLCRRPSGWRSTVWSACPYLLPLVFILVYYQLFLPYFSDSSNLSIAQQSRDMLMYVDETREMYLAEIRKGYLYLGDLEVLPAVASALLYFVFPGRFTVFRPYLIENLFVILSIGTTVAVSIEAIRFRSAHSRCTAIPMWILLMSGFTGCLEIPGYQGRAAYLLALPTVLYGLRYGYLACVWIARRVFHNVEWKITTPESLFFFFAVFTVILCWIPSWTKPPIAGKNINPRMSYLRKLPDHENMIRMVTSIQIDPGSSVLLIDTQDADTAKQTYLATPFGLYSNPWDLPVRYVTPPLDIQGLLHKHPEKKLFLLWTNRPDRTHLIGPEWEEFQFRSSRESSSERFGFYRYPSKNGRTQLENGTPVDSSRTPRQ